MKNGSVLNFATLGVMSVLASASLVGLMPAKADTVPIYQLDPSYTIRSEKTQESQRVNTVGGLKGESISVNRSGPDEKWLKVERDNGGSGYVNRHALKTVEIKDSFVVRKEPSMTGASLGTTGKFKNEMILTGHSKITTEKTADGSKKIQWLQVSVRGQNAWVSAGATRNLTAAPKTDPKPSPKPSLKPTVKTVVKAASKPVPPVSNQGADLPNKPPAPRASDRKPKASVATNAAIPTTGANASDGPAPAVRDRTRSKPTGAKADVEPIVTRNSETIRQKPVEIAAKSEPAKPPVPESSTAPSPAPSPRAWVEPPNTKPKIAAGPECVRTKADFDKSEALKKAYGKMNPYTDWSGPISAAFIKPDADGVLIAHSPDPKSLPMDIPGLKPKYILQVCQEKGEPYIMMEGKRQKFSGPEHSELKLSISPILPDGTFTRKAGTVQ